MVRNYPKKGYALIWAVLIAAILLIISSTMANSIIKEVYMSSRNENSNNAYMSAQSGIDWATYYVHNECSTDSDTPGWDGVSINKFADTSHQPVAITTKVDDTTGSIATVAITADNQRTLATGCATGSYVDHGNITIESTGQYQGTSRKVVKVLKPSTPLINTATSDALSNTYDLGKSSSIAFDYWTSNPAIDDNIGLTSNDASRLNIYYNSTLQQFEFSYINPSGVATAGSTVIPIIVDSQHLSSYNSFAFHIIIDYSQGLAAKVNISQKRSGDIGVSDPYGLDCLGASVIDMSEAVKFNPFGVRFYPYTGSSLVDDTSGGNNGGSVDGKLIKLPTNGYVTNFSKKGYSTFVSTTMFALAVNINPSLAADATGNGSWPAWSNQTAGYSVHPHWVFDKWTGDCANGNTVLMDDNKSCTANFKPGYQVTVSVATVPSGTFTMNGMAVNTFAYLTGQIVNIVETPNAGSDFSGWGGACSGTASTCTVTVTSADINVTASFVSSSWISVGPLRVYPTDLPVTTWGPSEECMTANHTTLGNDCDATANLITGAKNLFASYPAQQSCLNVGGRLPTKAELATMYTNKATIGGFNSFWYWTSTEFSANTAWFQNFLNGAAGQFVKNNSTQGSVRCVK